MIGARGRRRQQGEQQIDRLAIDRFIDDRGLEADKDAANLVQAFNPGMGNGDAITDAG